MPRRKISEYRSKKIVSEALDLLYVGWSITSDESGGVDFSAIEGCKSYVVKVDQAVKGRFKKGLVLLDVKQGEIGQALKKLQHEGYRSFVVEPYVKHSADTECYLSLMQDRAGIHLSYSTEGGVDIESKGDTVVSCLIDDVTDWNNLAAQTELSVEKLQTLVATFTKNYFVFLEINPYVVTGDSIIILDCAVEVDDAGAYFTHTWTEDDVRTAKSTKATPEELAVRVLDANSPASFNLSVLNPNGSIFLLLSGGGASVVIADEVYNQGYGEQLANYGEYSGNPNIHEAYLYTAEVMKLLLASTAKQKIVFIGGAVANFTDIANTFAGVIQAIDEYAAQLKKQKVKIYVRRGGPRQEIGLAKMHTALEKHDLLGGVYDPSTTITDALGAALKGLKK
jgi:ATP-citrate lyase beta-subunit